MNPPVDSNILFWKQPGDMISVLLCYPCAREKESQSQVDFFPDLLPRYKHIYIYIYLNKNMSYNIYIYIYVIYYILYIVKNITYIYIYVGLSIVAPSCFRL